MQRTPTRRAAAITGAAALAMTLGLGIAPTARAHAGGSSTPVVVVDQLDNPRQLAVGHRGSLLVAEAGSGGTNCVGEGEDEFCLGPTSTITKVARPWSASAQASTVAGGLPSGAGSDGSFAIGTNGVGMSPSGTIYGVNSASDASTPADDPGGKLFTVKRGSVRIVADIAGYENAKDPDGQGAESNGYAVLAQKHRTLVADAAGNTVLAVSPRGRISVFRTFPNITTGACAGLPNDAGTTGCDFVPTALAAGPGGSVYVTGLASEVPGEGRVVWLTKHGKVIKQWKGFTTPTGVVAGPRGSFYVSELFANADFENPNPPAIGQVTKVRFNGARSSRPVPLPAGLAIVGNRLYVAAYSVAPAGGLFGNPAWNGQIWRMSL